jgi:hypothetical protein
METVRNVGTFLSENKASHPARHHYSDETRIVFGLRFKPLGQLSGLRVVVVLLGPFNKCRGGTSF